MAVVPKWLPTYLHRCVLEEDDCPWASSWAISLNSESIRTWAWTVACNAVAWQRFVAAVAVGGRLDYAFSASFHMRLAVVVVDAAVVNAVVVAAVVGGGRGEDVAVVVVDLDAFGS